MSKAIILSRVSTLNQDLQQQTEDVLKFAAADGYDNNNIEIIEDKESGVKLTEEDRLGLVELKRKILANPGMYGCVYAYEISRIGRRSEVNYSIRNFLQQNKVQLVILKPYIKLFDENFQIDETANMTFAIFNALAENEGYIRKERLARGKKKKQNSGGYVGGKLPYGYCIGPDKKIVVDPIGSKMIRYIFEEYVNKGRTTYNLGQELMQTGDIRSTTLASAVVAVRQILKHPAYICGKAEYRGNSERLANNIYPRIISDELFEAAQKKLTETAASTPKSSHKHIYYCKSILKDPRNGRTLIPHYSGGSYSCSHVTLTEKQNISIPIRLIDSFVWHLTQELYKEIGDSKIQELDKKMGEKMSVNRRKRRTAFKTLNELLAKEVKIQERIISGKLKEDIGDSMLDNIYIQRKQISNLLITIEQEDEQLHIKRFKIHTSYNDLDITKVSTDEERVGFIKDTINKIEVTKYPSETKKKRREPVGYFIVYYTVGKSEKYFFNNYTHEVWDENMKLIEYSIVNDVESINAKRYREKKGEQPA